MRSEERGDRGRRCCRAPISRMQRAAAKQLTRLVTCPLHRCQALFMNSTDYSPSLHHHQLLHLHRLHQSLHKLAIARSPSPFTLLRRCIHLSMLLRCFSNGSSLPSLIVHDSDGLPSTQQSIKDRNNARASDDCILKEAVDHYTSLSLSVGAHSNQDEKPALKGESQAGSLLLPETRRQVDTANAVSYRLLADPHCTQSSKDSKGDELVPSSDVAIHLQVNGLKEGAVLGGLETGVRHDLSEASSPSDIISRVIMDGGVKDSDDTVLDCQSSLEDAIRTESSEACISQSFEKKFDNSSDLSVDALSLSCILDIYGWGIHTENILQRFIGSITPELVASVVDLQKNVKVAFSFLEWAGNHEKFEHVEGTFTKVVGRLGKELDFELAWRVLEYMKKHGLKVDYAFSVFIHRLRSASLVDEVFKAMERMVSLDVIPTIPLFTVALQLILKANKLEEAHRLYKQMRQASLKPDTKLFGILISGFGRAGQVDDALSFFKDMQRDEVSPDSFTYTSLIRAFAAAGQFGEGQKFYTQMIQNKCLPKVLSPLDLDCALNGVSSMEEIHRFLENLEIGGHIISVYTYNNMLQHLVDNKMFLEAVEVFCRLSGHCFICGIKGHIASSCTRRRVPLEDGHEAVPQEDQVPEVQVPGVSLGSRAAIVSSGSPGGVHLEESSGGASSRQRSDSEKARRRLAKQRKRARAKHVEDERRFVIPPRVTQVYQKKAHPGLPSSSAPPPPPVLPSWIPVLDHPSESLGSGSSSSLGGDNIPLSMRLPLVGDPLYEENFPHLSDIVKSKVRRSDRLQSKK